MRSLAIFAAPVLGLVLAGPAVAQDAAKVEKGKLAYDAAAPKCKVCHSIGGVGNVKGSLDGVGAKLKADEIKAWLRTPKEATEKAKAARKPAMPAYPKEKLSDEDLEALTAYLLSIKK
jgi:mono/diheme cytochrome c family protein